LTAFVDDNRDAIATIRTWERAHPDDEKAFDDSHKATEQAIVAMVTKCQANAAFISAVQKLAQ
jgi:hypothetical protein